MLKIATVAIAALGATAVLAQPAVPSPKEQLEDVAIPREVAPALMPYLVCKQSEAGVSLYDSDGELMNPEGPPAEGCDAVRKKSKNHTINMLKDLNLGNTRGERAEFAERWLVKIEELSAEKAGS